MSILNHLKAVVLCLTAIAVCKATAGAESSRSITKERWSAYMKAMAAHVQKHWTPPISRTPANTILMWRIERNGTVSNIRIKSHGSSSADDEAAIKAVIDSSPFAPLPDGAGDSCEVSFSFDSVRPKPLNLTVDQALKKFGPDAKKRLLSKFQLAGAIYPPKQITLVNLKAEKLLLLFARDNKSNWKQIATYNIVSSCGGPGPKLKEGDLQIPEGIYKATNMDANTHLCLWVNYPNQQDRKNAALDHRTNLGGAIQIHEGVHSTGCIVIDHDDMSELFVLAHDIGVQQIKLIMSPCNLLCSQPAVDFKRQPKWLPLIYSEIKSELTSLPITLK